MCLFNGFIDSTCPTREKKNQHPLVNKLTVYLMTEYDLPKGRERLEDYWKYVKESIQPMQNRLNKEDFFKSTAFGDNTGHMVWLMEFKDTHDFGRLWNDEGYPGTMSGFALQVDNLSYRVGRPPIFPK